MPIALFMQRYLTYEEEQHTIPKNLKEQASCVDSDCAVVFTADCVQTASSSIPLCSNRSPPLIATFVRVNRDDYMKAMQTWNIFGIPSFVVTQKGQELGRQ